MWTGVVAFTDDLLPVVGEFGLSVRVTLPAWPRPVSHSARFIARMLAESDGGSRRRIFRQPSRPDRKGASTKS